MAENTSAQEKTETATPRRREKARQEGNVARSMEVGSVVILSVSLIGLATLGGEMTNIAGDFLRNQFRSVGSAEITTDTTISLAYHLAGTMAAILVPFAALIVVAGIGSNVAQTGVLITLQPLTPKFDRLSPLTGVKRLFSKRSSVELVKSLVKLAIVGSIVGWTLGDTADRLLPLMTVGLVAGYRTILVAILQMAAAGAFALALLAILDFFFQRWDHEQQIKMTRQEVKEEHKQNEGDPLLKSKVRARQQEMSRARMMEDVKTADVVVTNPIRFAVALKYEPAKMAAPRVVAKGARLLAKRIREIAREAGVPVVEDPPLARSLYKACKIGGHVPLSLYKAVAELLAFLYRDREGVAPGGAR